MINISRYCLSQPNAMKFLAQNHAFNWESCGWTFSLNQLAEARELVDACSAGRRFTVSMGVSSGAD